MREVRERTRIFNLISAGTPEGLVGLGPRDIEETRIERDAWAKVVTHRHYEPIDNGAFEAKPRRNGEVEHGTLAARRDRAANIPAALHPTAFNGDMRLRMGIAAFETASGLFSLPLAFFRTDGLAVFECKAEESAFAK